MKLFQRRKAAPVKSSPAVTEARRAREQSQERAAEAREDWGLVHEVVASLRGHRLANGFSEMIQQSYQERRP